MKVHECDKPPPTEAKKTCRLVFGMKRDSFKSNAIHPLCTDSTDDTFGGDRSSSEMVPLIRGILLYFGWKKLSLQLTRNCPVFTDDRNIINSSLWGILLSACILLIHVDDYSMV